MSAVAVASMTEQDARRLTERIRIAAVNYTEAKGKLMGLVKEAKDGSAHLALGYPSWTAYLAEVLGEEPLRLARDERKEVVQLLASEGVGAAAISPIVGITERQVRRDIGQMSEVPPTSTGMDGKTYARTEPQPEPVAAPAPKRRPVTDQAQDAAWELLRAAEKLQRVISDDRFPKHRETISTHIKGNLNNALTILNTIDNAL